MRALENYLENAPKSINFTVEIDFIHINFTHKIGGIRPIILWILDKKYQSDINIKIMDEIKKNKKILNKGKI